MNRRDDKLVRDLVTAHVRDNPDQTVTEIARAVRVRDQTVRCILTAGPFSSSTRTGRGGTARVYYIVSGGPESPSHRVDGEAREGAV